MGDIGPVRQRYEVLPVPEPVMPEREPSAPARAGEHRPGTGADTGEPER